MLLAFFLVCTVLLLVRLWVLIDKGSAIERKIRLIEAGGSPSSFRHFVSKVGASSAVPPSVLVAISVGNAEAISVAEQVASFRRGWQKRHREALWGAAAPEEGARSRQRTPGFLREWGLVGGNKKLKQEEVKKTAIPPPSIRVVFLVNGFEDGAVQTVQRELSARGVETYRQVDDLSTLPPSPYPPVVMTEVHGLKHRFWMKEVTRRRRKKLAETILQQDDFAFVFCVDADVIFSPAGGFDIERFIFGSAAVGAYVSQPVISPFAPSKIGSLSKLPARGVSSLSKTCCSWHRGT